MLRITEENPTQLEISVVSKDNINTKISYIMTQNMQNIQMDLPQFIYDTQNLWNLTVQSTHYRNDLRDMIQLNLDDVILVSCTATQLTIMSGSGNNFAGGKKIIYGEDNGAPVWFSEYYHKGDLSRLGKITCVSKTLTIIAKEDEPLVFKTNVGKLGIIHVFIKSKRQIEAEN